MYTHMHTESKCFLAHSLGIFTTHIISSRAVYFLFISCFAFHNVYRIKRILSEYLPEFSTEYSSILFHINNNIMMRQSCKCSKRHSLMLQKQKSPNASIVLYLGGFQRLSLYEFPQNTRHKLLCTTSVFLSLWFVQLGRKRTYISGYIVKGFI